MCTTSRMIYILTYRALREFANGRKSVNPIEELHKMETCVPFSVCGKTHDVMMKAQRSFNQRFLAPVGVHEPLSQVPAKYMTRIITWNNMPTGHFEGRSHLRRLTYIEVCNRIATLKNRAYARKATRAAFDYELWAQSL